MWVRVIPYTTGGGSIEPKYFEDDLFDTHDAIEDSFGDSYQSKYRPGIYKASSVWKCQRKLFYQRFSKPPMELYEPGDPFPPGLGASTDDAENWFVNALRSKYGYGNVLGGDRQSWVKIDIDGITVRGLFDALIIGYNLEPLYLYEVKSKSSVEDFTDLSTHHKYQAGIYDRALDPKHGASVVYVERQDYGNTVERPFEINEREWQNVESYFLTYDRYDREQEVPPPLPMAGWECHYCGFKDQCKKDSPEAWEDGYPSDSREGEWKKQLGVEEE